MGIRTNIYDRNNKVFLRENSCPDLWQKWRSFPLGQLVPTKWVIYNIWIRKLVLNIISYPLSTFYLYIVLLLAVHVQFLSLRISFARCTILIVTYFFCSPYNSKSLVSSTRKIKCHQREDHSTQNNNTQAPYAPGWRAMIRYANKSSFIFIGLLPCNG